MEKQQLPMSQKNETERILEILSNIAGMPHLLTELLKYIDKKSSCENPLFFLWEMNEIVVVSQTGYRPYTSIPIAVNQAFDQHRQVQSNPELAIPLLYQDNLNGVLWTKIHTDFDNTKQKLVTMCSIIAPRLHLLLHLQSKNKTARELSFLIKRTKTTESDVSSETSVNTGLPTVTPAELPLITFKLLDDFRKSNRYSVKEFCRVLGIRHTTWHRIKNQTGIIHNPTIALLLRLYSTYPDIINNLDSTNDDPSLIEELFQKIQPFQRATYQEMAFQLGKDSTSGTRWSRGGKPSNSVLRLAQAILLLIDHGKYDDYEKHLHHEISLRSAAIERLSWAIKQ